MFPEPLEHLIAQLSRLPGVGPKTAQRLAFHLLELPRPESENLAAAIIETKDRVLPCPVCGNLSDGGLCRICDDSRRDDSVLCIVADVRDLAALEKTRAFQGRYHVLGGLLSPMDGIGPDELSMTALMQRLRAASFREVIIGTGSDVKGEATALYLSRVIAPLGIKVTRLASGLPMGADLEYADELTLARAVEGRRLVQ